MQYNKDISKYQGIIPAFYACYDAKGNVDGERVELLTKCMIEKGVKGVYVGGSSGECIYQTVPDRKKTLEHVMKAAEGKLTVIAQVACNNTAESRKLAAHAESLGVDAIAAIPPIYFHLPEYAIAEYWNDISDSAPNTDFVIYNIPQLAEVALTMPLFREMKKNPRVVAVKNSSMPTQDIQNAANDVIYGMCACHRNLYGVIKEILRVRSGLDIGGVRKPLPDLIPEDMEKVKKCADMIDKAIERYII